MAEPLEGCAGGRRGVCERHRSGAKEHRTAKRHVAVLIDTSILIDAERRGESLEQAIGDADRAISVITAGELLHGVHRARTATARARREYVPVLDVVPV